MQTWKELQDWQKKYDDTVNYNMIHWKQSWQSQQGGTSGV